MEHMGQFKCVISNEAGSDETAGKVTVKPVRTEIICSILINEYVSCTLRTANFV